MILIFKNMYQNLLDEETTIEEKALLIKTIKLNYDQKTNAQTGYVVVWQNDTCSSIESPKLISILSEMLDSNIISLTI